VKTERENGGEAINTAKPIDNRCLYRNVLSTFDRSADHENNESEERMKRNPDSSPTIHTLIMTGVFSLLALCAQAKAAERMEPGQWIKLSQNVKLKRAKLVGNNYAIGYAQDNATATFGPFDLSDGLVDRIEVKLASPASRGKLVFFLDKVGDNQIAEVDILATGGYSDYAICQGAAEQLAGTHSIIMQFKGGEGLCNMQSFRFLKPGQPDSQKLITRQTVNNAPSLKDELANILSSYAPAIEKNRTALINLMTSPGASITIQQKRHAFEFGTAISRSAFTDSKLSAADKAKYKAILLQNFNSVVHENAMKWYSNERERDVVTFADADAMLDWSEANGIYTRGHCVYWGRDQVVQGWIKELNDAELREELKERAHDYMQHFKDRVPEHDMNNEMVHCHYYANRLGPGIRHEMFSWCQELDPDTKLYVNDYSILSGGSTQQYIRQIKAFLEAGVPVAGIGVQGHFGKYVNGSDVTKKLNQLAQFKLPIKITEFDANTRNEAEKARALATLYCAAFAHPAVEGIYMWGFWERAHWRPKAAIWKGNWTETQAAKWYRELVFKHWWSNIDTTADSTGNCSVRVFHGDHEITVNGKKHTISVNSQANGKTITLR